MQLHIHIDFEDNFFYEFEPDPKNGAELAMLIMLEAAGKRVSIKAYNERDIMKCARALILRGFIRGTVVDEYTCSWSRLTKKGYIFLKAALPEIFDSTSNIIGSWQLIIDKGTCVSGIKPL